MELSSYNRDKFVYFSACICSIHFDASCFEVSLKHKLLQWNPSNLRDLKPDSIPTLNLGIPEASKSVTVKNQRLSRLLKRQQKELVQDILKQSCEFTINLTESTSSSNSQTIEQDFIEEPETTTNFE